MSKNWVDFNEIKASVTMQMVLEYYGLVDTLKRSGKNLVGCCPIHKGSSPRQFSVNSEKNIFNCFGDCKSGGNVLDFVMKMEEVTLREAGLRLQKWFLGKSSGEKIRQSKADEKEKLVREERQGQDTEVNQPLKFELKTLEPQHAFFDERGIEPATIKHFSLGFCSRGLMAGRIVIPVHDGQGRLVAYCGRAVSDEQKEKEGKYKMPANFIKSKVVYNIHRQDGPGVLVLVESFLSVFWLYQAGFSNVVALMGSSLSDEQKRLLVDTLGPSGQTILLFDGDEDGKKCTQDCLTRLSPKVFVKALDISQYAPKPHKLSPEIIKKLLG